MTKATKKDQPKTEQTPTPPTSPPPMPHNLLPSLPPPPPALPTEFISRKDRAINGPKFYAYPGYLVLRVSAKSKQELDNDPGWLCLTKDTPGYLLNAQDFETDDKGFYRYRSMYLFAVREEYWQAQQQDQLRQCYEKISGILPQQQQQVGNVASMLPDSHIDFTERVISTPPPVNAAAFQAHMDQMYAQGMAQVTPAMLAAQQQMMAQQMQQMYAHAQPDQQGPYSLETLVPDEGAGVTLSPEEQAQLAAHSGAEEVAGPVLGAGANATPEGGENP
ncbi:MAG: hypothetical protein ACYDCO_01785 [Armatimonadota bacterium]